MISFDVKCLFTNVSFKEKMAITVRKVYYECKIKTSISRKKIRDLLFSCTNKACSFYIERKNIYYKRRRCTMGSPFDLFYPVFLMTVLEEDVIPTLGHCLVHWKKSADEAHVCINPDQLDVTVKALNNYHPKMIVRS